MLSKCWHLSTPFAVALTLSFTGPVKADTSDPLRPCLAQMFPEMEREYTVYVGSVEHRYHFCRDPVNDAESTYEILSDGTAVATLKGNRRSNVRNVCLDVGGKRLTVRTTNSGPYASIGAGTFCAFPGS